MSKKRQDSTGKKRVRVSSKPESSIPKVPGGESAGGRLPGRTEATRPGSRPGSRSGNAVRGSQGRSRVEIDPAPATRRLPEIPQEVSSSPLGTNPPQRKGWSSTIDFRISTLAIFAMCNVLLLCLAFIGGRSSISEPLPPLAVNEELPRDDSWPILNPAPPVEGEGLQGDGLRNVLDSEGQPLDLSAPVVSEMKLPAESEDLPPQVVVTGQKMYAVMVGQKLTAELEIIDQLLNYVDSGLTDGVSRVRVKEQRDGFKRYDVYVGPFSTEQESRRALAQLMDLRPTLGIRFADSYITRMEFSPEELRALEQ